MGRDMCRSDISDAALSEQLEVYRPLSMGFLDRNANGGKCLQNTTIDNCSRGMKGKKGISALVNPF